MTACPYCCSREYAQDPMGAYWCWGCDKAWFPTTPEPSVNALVAAGAAGARLALAWRAFLSSLDDLEAANRAAAPVGGRSQDEQERRQIAEHLAERAHRDATNEAIADDRVVRRIVEDLAAPGDDQERAT